MPVTTPPRRRAVRLTPEASEALQAAVVARWEEEAGEAKLTRQGRADLLGVSLATATRLFAGEGVDRATLAHAYRRVGLEWVEEPCDGHEETDDAGGYALACEEESGGGANSEPPAPEPTRTVPAPKRSRRPLRLAATLALAAGALAAGALVFGGKTNPDPNPARSTESDVAFEDGLACFHRADYAGADASARRAVLLARAANAPGDLSNALRLVGDVRGAQGRLPEASRAYAEALQIRTLFARDAQRPAILEALGDVETRRGNLDAARRALRESLDGYARHGDPVGVAMAARDLGTVEFRAGSLDAADRLFDRSLDALKGARKPEIVADVEGRRALVTLRRGRPAEALAVLRTCEAFWVAREHPRWTAVSRLRLGMACAALGHRSDADAYFRASRDGFERLGDRAGVKEAEARLTGRKDAFASVKRG